jgi:NADH:ubiquinone oxidoreductase subunit 6 (subunit J)
MTAGSISSDRRSKSERLAYITMLLFAAVSIVALICTYLVLVLKDILHVVIAFVLVVIAASALMLFVGQPLIAVIQLLIMVGGIATYLLVGSASVKFNQANHTNIPAFAVLSSVLFIVLVIASLRSGVSSYSPYSPFTGGNFDYGQTFFYLLIITLFSVSVSSIMLFKRVVFQ